MVSPSEEAEVTKLSIKDLKAHAQHCALTTVQNIYIREYMYLYVDEYEQTGTFNIKTGKV